MVKMKAICLSTLRTHGTLDLFYNLLLNTDDIFLGCNDELFNFFPFIVPLEGGKLVTVFFNFP